MKVINYGSLNIDYVYRVPHISGPGETLSSSSFEVFAGGKGANQSVALAKAGTEVLHAGKVGRDGRWLIDRLGSFGVDTRFIAVDEGRTGHAIIQVDDSGENSIVLHAGANNRVRRKEIDAALENAEPGDILLLQNEINELPYLISKAHESGMKICLNPAPFGDEVLDYPLDLVDTFIVNRIEGEGLTGRNTPEEIVDGLSSEYPQCEIILTLGRRGAVYYSPSTQITARAMPVEAVDTTAAGDTFIGYFIAWRIDGATAKESLEIACKAAAICVSRKGAQDSIPDRDEVLRQ